MRYLICTFADSDKRDKNYLTTYQVRETVEEREYTDDLLTKVAEEYGEQGSRKCGFVLTDEETPRMIRWSYLWSGQRYIENDCLGIDGNGAINTKVLKIINQ